MAGPADRPPDRGVEGELAELGAGRDGAAVGIGAGGGGDAQIERLVGVVAAEDIEPRQRRDQREVADVDGTVVDEADRAVEPGRAGEDGRDRSAASARRCGHRAPERAAGRRRHG